MIVDSVKVFVYPDGRLDASNAAIYLGLSRKTLAMFRSTGRGPKYIKRGRIFYYITDLDDWLNANGRAASTSQSRANKVSSI